MIHLDVTYNSDLKKIHKILLKTTTKHPKIIHKPIPKIFFTTFNTNTLNHKLHLYIHKLHNHNHTIDKLNHTIDQLYRKNDINITFNQLKIHLHNEKNDKITKIKHDYKNDNPTPTIK